MSSVSNMPLPPAPTISTVPSSMSQSKKQHSVSDFSDLFGDDGDSSGLFSGLPTQPTSNLSTSFSGSLSTSAAELKPEHSTYTSHQSSSAAKTESPYKIKREEGDNKRRSSDKLASEEKKPRLTKSGGLFSPSPPDEKPAIPLSSLKSPIKQESDHKRTRSSSSSSKDDAVVNVQKLENLAPEFQAMVKGSSGSASIIVDEDGMPSPSKVKKEGNPSPLKKEKSSSQAQDSSQDKRRSGSGPSKDKI